MDRNSEGEEDVFSVTAPAPCKVSPPRDTPVSEGAPSRATSDHQVLYKKARVRGPGGPWDQGS